MLFNGDGVELNKEEAIKLYSNAAQNGHIDSMYNYGDGIQNDNSLAENYLRKAASNGNITAMNK